MKQLMFVVALFLSLTTFGQTPEWNLYAEKDGVQFYVKNVDCVSPEKGTAKQYIFIKLINSNEFSVDVNFHKSVSYGSVASISKESSTRVSLDAGKEVYPDCDSSKDLKVFVKMLDLEGVRSLQSFELKNITVEEAD